jgi:choline kinase
LTNAIILAAGQGKRLGRLTHGRPKCLLSLGTTTIIEHQIANLRLYGLNQITVVVGYEAEQVKHLLGDTVSYVYNPIHDRTNSLYSLWLARQPAHEGFILLNGDVVFHPLILERLLVSPYPDALTVELKTEFDVEQMKVALDGDRVVGISKALETPVAAGENLGVVKFSRDGAQVLCQKVEALVAQGRVNEWCPRAFDAIAPYHPLFAVDVGKLPWIEVDFPEDWRAAVELIYPQIERGLVPSCLHSSEPLPTACPGGPAIAVVGAESR